MTDDAGTPPPAPSPRARAERSARPAPSDGSAPIPSAALDGVSIIVPTSPGEPVRIESNGTAGSEPTGSESGSTSPTSKPPEPPSDASKMRWRTPRNAREFAAQANRVATRVLNGEIDVETARLYSNVARTMVQALSSEVTRARFVKEEPDLALDDSEMFEDAEAGDPEDGGNELSPTLPSGRLRGWAGGDE